MESADPLYSQDLPPGQHLSGSVDRLRSSLRPPCQKNLGAAVIAAHRLRVISAGSGIFIFFRAGGAHRELLHAGSCPVIGQLVQDGKTRTALGTVDKWMKITAVSGIIQLPPAFRTGRDVGRDKDVSPFLLTLCNLEGFQIRPRSRIPDIDLQDDRPLRRIAAERQEKPVQFLLCSLGYDLYVRAPVAYRPGDSLFHRRSADKRAEPHSLHDPVQPDSLCLPPLVHLPVHLIPSVFPGCSFCFGLSRPARTPQNDMRRSSRPGIPLPSAEAPDPR